MFSRMLTKKTEGKQMANQEHLEILKQGISVWNMWREQYPKIQPDLSGINLEEVNLSSTNRLRIHHHLDAQERYWLLEGEMDDAANFSHANLAGTVLSRAILCSVNFSEANLSDADLTDADF